MITFTNTATILTITGASAGDTMRDVVTAVADANIIELVGNVITLKRAVGQTYKGLTFNNGVIISLTAGDTLNIQGSTNTATPTQLVINTTAEFTVGAGCTINFNSDNQATSYGYWYSYGKFTAVGTLGNEIIIKKYRNFYLCPRMNTTIQYVKFQDFTLTSAYCIYADYSALTFANGYIPTVIIQNVTIENTNANYYGSGLYFPGYNIPFTNWTFDNIIFNHLSYVIYGLNGNHTLKLTNCRFLNITNNTPLYNVGGGTHPVYNTSKVEYTNRKNYQPYFYFENCIFDTCVAGVTLIMVYYVSLVYFKNCTFRNETNGVYCQFGGIAMWEGINTFTNVTTNRLWTLDGTHLHCRDVSITVKDINNNPIENAQVSIRQSQDYERWSGFTDVNGQLKNIWGNNTKLVEKEETATNTFVNWSDSIASGRYHIITVTKEGFSTETQNIEVTSDKTLTFVLTPINNEGTNINNATLVNAYIT